MAMGAVTVTNSATVIVAANSARHSLLIGNNSTQTVFLGDSTVTKETGIPLPAGATYLEDASGTSVWGGAIYGVVSASTADVHYWQRTRGV